MWSNSCFVNHAVVIIGQGYFNIVGIVIVSIRYVNFGIHREVKGHATS